MALNLIEIKDFPKTTTLVGSGEELIVVSKADGKTYGIKTSDFKQFLGTVTSITPKPLNPTDPSPVLDGVYIPTIDGTYANAGGLKRETGNGQPDYGMAVEFIKNGATWVKVKYPLPQAINKIPLWEAKTYLKGEQVNIDGQIWESNTSTLASDKPGDSRKWTPLVNTDSIVYMASGIGSMDWKFIPEMKEGFYVGRTGAISTSTSIWSASVDLIRLNVAEKLEYSGNFGASGTSIAFYNALGRFISSVPLVDGSIYNITIDVPVSAVFVRVSCRTSDIGRFFIRLIKMKSPSFLPRSFSMAGGNFVYYNGTVKEADIVWDNGDTGRVIFSDWDDSELTFKAFEATALTNKLTVNQPSITFDGDGKITNYPTLIYTKNDTI